MGLFDIPSYVVVVFFGLLEATHAMDLNYGQMPVEVFGLFVVTVFGLINAGWNLTSTAITKHS